MLAVPSQAARARARAGVSAYLFPVVVKLTLERVGVASGRAAAVIEIQSRPDRRPAGAGGARDVTGRWTSAADGGTGGGRSIGS